MIRMFYFIILILTGFITSCTHIKKADVKSDSVNSFENKAVRIKVESGSWHYIKAKEHLQGVKHIKLRDKKLQKFMMKEKSPLLVLMKYKLPYSDVNPSIKVDMVSVGTMSRSETEKIVKLNMDLLKKASSNFKVITQPESVYVSGLKGSYAHVQYEIKNKAGSVFFISSELWIIPKDGYFIMIGAATRADEKTGTRKEIKDIIKTIEFI